MSYYDELDKVLAMTRDRPAGLIPRKSGIDFPRDSEGERLSLSSDPPKKPRLSAHATTPNPRHCESDGKGESSGEQKKGKKTRKRPRSEGSRKRRVAINCKKLRSKILRKRGDECRNRAAFHKGLMPLSARVCFFPEQLLAKDRRCSKVVRDFYVSHGESNRYLTVSEGANVSNPSGVKGGGKGVFARTDIPKGTLVCPYLGKLRAKHCPAVDLCQYDMLLGDRGVICAREITHDVGYLYDNWEVKTDHGFRKGAILNEAPCPPNYARYVNSLTKEQLGGGAKFNCRFDEIASDVDGNEDPDVIEVFLKTLRDISAGEELLASYGDTFILA